MKIIPNNITQTIGRKQLLASKHAPRVMFVGGVVGVVGAAVLACRATLKLNDTLDHFKYEVDEVKAIGEGEAGKYDDQHYYKDLSYVYIKGSVKIVRLYAPAILLGTASIGALTGAHLTLSKRNASLTAAYSALAMSYDAYRDRVREEYGEEKEHDIYHAAQYETQIIDGKKTVVKVYDENGHSPYAINFDMKNRNWQRTAELNRFFINCQQTFANDRLHAQGHIFLNEVYESLGMPHTKAGAIVGWVSTRHGGQGDNYVDFGIYEATRAHGDWEPNIILDFNVDGNILDLI